MRWRRRTFYQLGPYFLRSVCLCVCVYASVFDLACWPEEPSRRKNQLPLPNSGLSFASICYSCGRIYSLLRVFPLFFFVDAKENKSISTNMCGRNCKELGFKDIVIECLTIYLLCSWLLRNSPSRKK